VVLLPGLLLLLEEVLLALLLVLYLLVVEVVEHDPAVLVTKMVEVEVVNVAPFLMTAELGLVDKGFGVVILHLIVVTVSVPQLYLLAGAGVQAQLVAMQYYTLLIVEEMVGVVVLVTF
jgi:hypothetical protein